MSELSITKCEQCNGRIERVITGGTGLIFKGSGFYLTDYKDEKKIDGDTAKKDEGNTKKTKPDELETKGNKTKNKSPSQKVTKSDE